MSDVMTVGIDQMAVYVPPFKLEMGDLASVRGVDPKKFDLGIGQDEMAVAPLTQDTVAMGLNAAIQLFDRADKVDQQRLDAISLVIFASETGVDHSKAGAVFLTDLLPIKQGVRSFEVKQACYGGTAGLQLATSYVHQHPEETVLVVASDNAKYGLKSGGEPTQGAGAVAMLISQGPRIAKVSDVSAYHTADVADFWRPTDQEYPLVDGPLSKKAYLDFFNDTFTSFIGLTHQTIADFTAICCHVPYTKLGEKALAPYLEECDKETAKRLRQYYQQAVRYNRVVGNIYTGSLYLSLFSLLAHEANLAPDSEIGMFSYGSGAVGEFFSLYLSENYTQEIQKHRFEQQLTARNTLTIDEYEALFEEKIPTKAKDFVVTNDHHDPSEYQLKAINNGHRVYSNPKNR